MNDPLNKIGRLLHVSQSARLDAWITLIAIIYAVIAAMAAPQFANNIIACAILAETHTNHENSL